jgi:hypothetical protein
VHLHVDLSVRARMIVLASSNMMSVHAMMTVAVVMTAGGRTSAIAATIATVVMIRVAVMVVVIKDADMMMIALVVAMMKTGAMEVDVVASVTASPPLTSIPPARYVTSMGTQPVTVGGAMVMIPVVMATVGTKVPTSLESTPTGTMTLAPPTTSPAN